MGAAEIMVDGKWLPKNGGEEDRADCRSPEEKSSAIKERQLGQHPWGTMSLGSRALKAVIDLANRAQGKNGWISKEDDVDSLLAVIQTSIRALERCPRAREIMSVSAEWPTMVPGGPEDGPLRKGWAKSFAALNVGKDRVDLPLTGKTDYSKGKPALVCRELFKVMEGLRLDGPNGIYQELMKAGQLQPEPEWMTAARSLPKLDAGSITQWRDLALAVFAEAQPDWRNWLSMTPGRTGTALTKAKKKAANLPGEFNGIDVETAKATIALFLLDGFKSLVKDAAEQVK
jgi:hypothetical protein